MKNLELIELTSQELVTIDGGSLWKWIRQFPAFHDALQDFGAGFKEGFKDAYK